LINVVSPRVMSQTVGLHPLLVLVAVLVGGKLAGVWGAIFGVPIAGVLVAMVAFYRLTLDERRQHAAALAGRTDTAAELAAEARPSPESPGV
jgi:predicted PurR-regulated permease PerM